MKTGALVWGPNTFLGRPHLDRPGSEMAKRGGRHADRIKRQRRLAERFRLLALLVVAVLVTSSCSATNLAEVIKAAGQDQATVCSSGVYAGASLNFVRTNCTNCEMDCNNGHLTIKSQPPSIPVGVQLVPK